MAPHVIISYDGTENDRDALMLGRQLHEAGATLTLAYVRHARLDSAEHEQLAAHEAQTLLERGAATLDDPSVAQRVVISPSTAEGLTRLAGEIGADVIVFGSDYRTPQGRVAIGKTAQTLLENGSTAVGLAPAGYAAAIQSPQLSAVGVLPGAADEAALQTAHSIAGRYDATVSTSARGVELVIVGSRPEAQPGRVMITSAAANAIEEATAPVLVVARGTALSFQTLVTA